MQLDINTQIRYSNILFRKRDAMRSLQQRKFTFRDVVFECLKDAMQVERVIRMVGPRRSLKSSNPEIHYTEEDLRQIEKEIEKDRIDHGPDRSVVVPKDALLAYDDTMTWLRYVRSSSPTRTRHALIALASGMSMARVAVVFGYPKRRAVESMKRSALINICEVLRQCVPHNFLGD